MTPNQFKKQTKLVGIIGLIILCLSCGLVIKNYLQYKNSIFQATSSQEQLSNNIKSFSQTSDLELMRVFLEKNDSKKFIETYQVIEKKSKKIQSLTKLSIFDKWFTHLEVAKELFERNQNLENYSKNNIIIKNNVSSLLKLAELKKWSRIIKLSLEMQLRLKSINLKDPTKTMRYIKSESNNIRSLATTYLKETDQQNVISFLDKIEIAINKVYLLAELQNEIKEWEAISLEMMTTINLELSLLQQNSSSLYEQDEKYFIYSLVFFMLLSFLFVAQGYRATEIFSKKYEKMVEQEIDKLLRVDIDRGQSTLDIGSPVFKKEAERHLGLIKQKLVLGQDFQQGIPLSTFILNQDCKVLWGNELFLDFFKLNNNDLGQSFLDWDYLKKFLIFNGEDPLISIRSTLTPMLSQMSLQKNHGEIIPFEVYLTPVLTESEYKVFVMMTPLDHVQQTIKDQINLLKLPTEEILQYLSRDQLSLESFRDLTSPLKKLEMNEMIELFKNVHQLQVEKSNKLFLQDNEIEKLNKEIEIIKENLEEKTNTLSQFYKEYQTQAKSIKNLLITIDQQFQTDQAYNLEIKKEWRHLFIGIHQFKTTLVDVYARLKDLHAFTVQNQFLKKANRDAKEKASNQITNLLTKIDSTLISRDLVHSIELDLQVWENKIAQIEIFISKLLIMTQPQVLNESLIGLDGSTFQMLIDKIPHQIKLQEEKMSELISHFEELYHINQKSHSLIQQTLRTNPSPMMSQIDHEIH